MIKLVQSFQPRIEVFSRFNSKKSTGVVFDGRSENGLLSYEFNRSLTISGGTFNFTFKDTTQAMDKMSMLDYVKFYEHDKLAYIGIITDISFSASASSGRVQKTVSVSGKTIEYLFDMLQISLDITALAVSDNSNNSGVKNISLVTELIKEGTKSVSIADGLNTAFDHFKTVLNGFENVSSIQILKMIGDIFGSTNFNQIAICGNIQFKYPLSSNLYRDKTVKFLDLLRNLLPNPVYEIFGRIGKDDRPKLYVRECPFDSTDWTALKSFRIAPEYIRDYSMQRSCDEVYTEFVTYVEGSNLSPDFYRKIYATKDGNVRGYQNNEVNKEKAKVYGYRPLEVTFSGFYTGKNDTETTQINNSLNDEMAKMNKRLSEWFSYLDEMNKGSVTFINVSDIDKATIGERAIISGNEFYIQQEKHSWNCNGTPTITYSLDRGGKYDNGKFAPCENMSKFLGEWE